MSSIFLKNLIPPKILKSYFIPDDSNVLHLFTFRLLLLCTSLKAASDPELSNIPESERSGTLSSIHESFVFSWWKSSSLSRHKPESFLLLSLFSQIFLVDSSLLKVPKPWRISLSNSLNPTPSSEQRNMSHICRPYSRFLEPSADLPVYRIHVISAGTV